MQAVVPAGEAEGLGATRPATAQCHQQEQFLACAAGGWCQQETMACSALPDLVLGFRVLKALKPHNQVMRCPLKAAHSPSCQ